jgi:23S rRNA pseudouridine955/2504/2580 synthase
LNIDTPQKSNVRFIEVGAAQVNQRLDNFLLKTLKNVPKTRVYRLIRKGEVRVNKKRCKPDYKLGIGDLIRIPPVKLEQRHDPKTYIAPGLIEGIEDAVLFENKHLIVIDKPAGLAVHSGSGINFGVIDIIRKMRPDTEVELVHRLDRDTSGCLLLAKHRQSLLEMQDRLQDNFIKKNYVAIVKDHWPENKTEITRALKKYTLANGERRVRVDIEGQKALTIITRNIPGDGYSVLSIQLLTGRTHQIRVHCQAEGHEIAGDTKYGDPEFNRLIRKRGVKRLMLHATRLELPATGFNPEIVINAKLPAIFDRLIDADA